MRRFAIAAALLLAPSLAQAAVWSGNDTGGIIPWSPGAEYAALAFANDQCRAASWGRKRARITSVRRVYGDYIVYECVFDGPLRRNGPG